MLGIDMDKYLNFTPYFDEIELNFKRKTKLIYNFAKYGNNNTITTLIKSFCHGKFNHGSPYIPLQHHNIYSTLQAKINKICNAKFTTKAERAGCNNYRIMDQSILLQRAGLISIPNLHRLNMMLRLNKILMDLEPFWEVEEVLQLFDKKSLCNFDFLRNGPIMKKPNQFSNLAPSIWVDEFNFLPKKLRQKLGSHEFLTNVKKFYHNRCQHKEVDERICPSCDESCTNFRLRVKDQYYARYIFYPFKNYIHSNFLDLKKYMNNNRTFTTVNQTLTNYKKQKN